MRCLKRLNKAQATLEFAVLIAAGVAALLAMRVYFQRGLQGKIRESADSYSSGRVYNPRNTTGVQVLQVESNVRSTSVTKTEASWGRDIDGGGLSGDTFFTESTSEIDHENTVRSEVENVGK